MVETHFSSDGYDRCVASMGVGRGEGRWSLSPCILKISAKKVVFLISSGKNKFHHFCPLEKFWKNPLVPPLEKFLSTPMVTL